MPQRVIKSYGPKRITNIVTLGSLYVAIALSGLLLSYDIIHDTLVRPRLWIGCGVIAYLLLVKIFLHKGKINTANWLIIILYELLAASVLIYWGLSSTAGILSACFAIVLPGILMAPRYIAPVAFLTFSVLFVTYLLHATRVIEPVQYIPSSSSGLLDIIAYSTILAIFALVSWVSARQSSLSLQAALRTEEALKRQKDQLAVELEKESARLRQAQIQEIQQLYRFAVIGQSATATLHELSNHLSVLNLDIDDLKQQYKHSKAIANAEEGIEYINRMVRRARLQLNAQNQTQTFNALPVINRVIKDMSPKFRQHHIKVIRSVPRDLAAFFVTGDPMNLMQCISILLNNALDACAETTDARVTVLLSMQDDVLKITVSDNGPGIKNSIRKSLFEPLESTKPTGLGVGLCIAKHLVEVQFHGTLTAPTVKQGASFIISLNRATDSK